MPGCAAINCSNSAKKGFLMKKFPKDPLRRKEWLITIKRDNWKPTDYSCLCEVHFAPEMWEKTREDGTRKLRSNAVPTLFSFTSSITKNKRKSPASGNELPITTTSESASANSLVEPAWSASAPSASSSPESSIILLEATSSKSFSENPERSPKRVEKLGVEYLGLVEKLERYNQLYNKLKRKVRYYKKMVRNMNRKVKDLEVVINRSSEYDLLKTDFNDDQLKRRDKKICKIMRWSSETVTKALKLRFSCGTSGYEELIKQRHPLPSTRTLQRRLHNLKFDSGVLHEAFNFLK